MKSLNNLAVALRDEGDLAGAVGLVERVLAIRRSCWVASGHGEDTNHRATRKAGRPSGGTVVYERALAIYQQALGPEHPTTASALYGLAVQSQGNFAKAIPLYERALTRKIAWARASLDGHQPPQPLERSSIRALLSLPLLERA